jgi:hypothetical protein
MVATTVTPTAPASTNNRNPTAGHGSDHSRHSRTDHDLGTDRLTGYTALRASHNWHALCPPAARHPNPNAGYLAGIDRPSVTWEEVLTMRNKDI